MTQKVKHHYLQSVTAFLDTVGQLYPRFTDHYHAAQYWTDNQEKIVLSINKFSEGHARIAASMLRQFGMLSESALYFNEVKAILDKIKDSEPCKA